MAGEHEETTLYYTGWEIRKIEAQLGKTWVACCAEQRSNPVVTPVDRANRGELWLQATGLGSKETK